MKRPGSHCGTRIARLRGINDLFDYLAISRARARLIYRCTVARACLSIASKK